MRWNRKGVPHKDWEYVEASDLRDEGCEPSDYATCEMCGREGIRFVYKMAHPDYSGLLSVGGTCASKMSVKKWPKAMRKRAQHAECPIVLPTAAPAREVS
jgi:hypothetical protein